MRLILVHLLLLLSDSIIAQIKIEGAVKNSNAEPVAFANVLLYSKGDTLKIIQGTTTDSLGIFKFIQVQNGEFIIKVHSIGYVSKQLVLESTNLPVLQLGTITIIENVQQLQTVSIVGKKQVIQQTNNGLVVNTEAVLTQQGGTAADILRGTPTVFVDVDGNISLRGKTPLILINGRNSKLDNLNSIPATSIEKIEIITSPGANYDAEAENGIINIIFKKKKTDGLNGAAVIGTGWGASWRFNSSAMTNYKRGAWNVGLSYDNRLAERTRNAEGTRVNFFLPTNYLLTQDRNDAREEAVHNFRGSIDYTQGKNAAGAEFLLGWQNEENNETLFSTFQNQGGGFESKNRRFSDEGRKAKQAEIALKYERKLNKEQQLLSFNFSNSFSEGVERTNINSQYLTILNEQIGMPVLQRTSFNDKSSVSNIRIDYTQKLGKGFLESGYKALLRFFDSDFSQENDSNGVFTPVPILTGKLEFREQVHAWYAQYKFRTKEHWDFEFGVRGEQTINEGRVKSQQSNFDNNYYNQFYNLSAGYRLADQKNLRLSLAKRINRPRLGQLNPFTDITDTLTQRSGNPELLPEISHNAELTHSLTFQKGNLLTRLYYRNSTNSILPFTELNTNGVLFTKPINAGTTITTGLEMIFAYNIFSFWTSNISASVFNQQIDAKNIGVDAVNNVWSWNAKWINDFTINKRIQLQVLSVFNSPVATIQGRTISVYNTDVAFQHKIWKEKARIGFIVTDVFNTQRSGIIWDTNDFSFQRIFKVDTRAALLTFAYTFGTTFKEKLMDNKFSND
jgi:outer membrane receptor protein involved in Fe transport